ncbi:uncharacterized protein AB675_8143 [Cyphellophora attinorum]|uniref:BTB domain-containing protein n=1 Tax=Cyphellophora attinorum TaxID=1664694 RepID=A0A0N1P1T6_9EURO|nr:uncharacterized protein AB675_8143 [Phialophora attinorum]KPI41265.1 hypothetical protein AB675_8143 [Phialophora attinorum]
MPNATGIMANPLDMGTTISRHTTEAPVKVVLLNDGQNSTTHYLPASLLSAKSGFFRGCFRDEGSFIEAVNGEVILHDVDLECFTLFVQWIYTGHVWTAEAVEAFAKDDSDGQYYGSDIQSFAAELWLLGDRLIAEEFQNHCMDILRMASATERLSTFVLKEVQDAVYRTI